MRILLPAALALLLLAGCVSRTTETFRPAIDPTAEVEVPPIGHSRAIERAGIRRPDPEPRAEAEPADPSKAKCEHEWDQVATHAYTAIVNGMPIPSMCFVGRCRHCGVVRHECGR